MQKSKTCFFEKISTIKSVTKAYLLSNLKHMGGNNTTLATAFFATALAAATPAMANKPDITAQGEAITCETKQACQDLTESIQDQIDALEAKGIAKLSNDEFAKFVNLKKQLIATEKQETEKNSNLIATKNQKLKAQQITQINEDAETLDIVKTDQKIAELRGALLEN